MRIKNKSNFGFLFLFIVITIFILKIIKIENKEYVVPINTFLILSEILIASCNLILVNIKINIDKVFLHSGVYMILMLFFIFTLSGAIFYNIFGSVQNFIYYNFILILLMITFVLIVIKVGVRKRGENA